MAVITIPDHVEDAQLEQEIKEALGKLGITEVPALMKVLCQDPVMARHHLDIYKSHFDNFPPEMVEAIGLAVATALSCRYCINWHSTTLMNLGFDEQKLLKLQEVISYFAMGSTISTGLQLTPDILPEAARKELVGSEKS